MANAFLPFLALLFIALKLTGYIAWSWLWVLSPLWVGALLALAVLVFLFGIGLASRH